MRKTSTINLPEKVKLIEKERRVTRYREEDMDSLSRCCLKSTAQILQKSIHRYVMSKDKVGVFSVLKKTDSFQFQSFDLMPYFDLFCISIAFVADKHGFYRRILDIAVNF